MKYNKKLNLYKSSNVVYNPETFEATSYGWWYFVKKINGLMVFNNYGYTNTTSRHQRKVSSLLHDLGIKIDYTCDLSGGLQEFNEAILPKLYRDLFQMKYYIKRDRIQQKTIDNHKKLIVWTKEKIKQTKKLFKVKITKEEIQKIEDNQKSIEHARLENIRKEKEYKATYGNLEMTTQLHNNNDWQQKANELKREIT